MGKGVDVNISAKEKKCVSQLQREILSAVAYYDIFNYPLTAFEISEYIKSPTDPTELLSFLNELVHLKLLSERNGFYFFFGSSSANIERRVHGNTQAEKIYPRALKSAKLISKFPFVEGVCISGSLSKNYFDKDADVDFFIVTRPGRLWICRTFLIAFKKIFLLNSKKYFCVNYFVDSNNLEIPDRNIFTATEISHLKPAYNYSSYEKFSAQNLWRLEFLPLKNTQSEENCLPEKKYFLKSTIQKILNGRIGEKLDNYFFKLTIGRWKKKFAHFDENDFDLNMRSRKTVSKHHPNGFQKKVLTAFEERLKKAEKMLGNL